MLTGIGTVKDDNPRLTVREVPTTRQPLRVVMVKPLSVPSCRFNSKPFKSGSRRAWHKITAMRNANS